MYGHAWNFLIVVLVVLAAFLIDSYTGISKVF
jgi:hypothetical protein